MSSLSFSMPIRTVSEANNRDHWSKKARRAKGQRLMARMMTNEVIPGDSIGHILARCKQTLNITITRIGKRKLDTDNLARSAKAVRDGIADAIGVDDGDERLTWLYAQDIGKTYSVRVEITGE